MTKKSRAILNAENIRQAIDYTILLLLSGPFLLGWIIGILGYPANHRRFLLGMQNFILTVIYFCALTLFYTAQKLFLFEVYYLYVIHSILAFAYISINTTIFFLALKGKTPVYGRVRSLLDNLISN